MEHINSFDDMDAFQSMFGEQEMSSTSIDSLKHLVKTLRETNEEYEKQKRLSSDLYRQCELLERKIIGILEAHNLKNFETEFGKVSAVNRYSVPVPKGEDFSAFKNYLIKANREDLLTCNSQSLNKFVKELIEQANESGQAISEVLPDGVQAPTLTTTLSFRKG